jgi:hypothetical protein
MLDVVVHDAFRRGGVASDESVDDVDVLARRIGQNATLGETPQPV